MGQPDMLQEVRTLRGQGLPPKVIARRLGIRPSEATALIRRIAAETPRSSAPRGGDVVRCAVSSGWSRGLTIAGHPDWVEHSEASDVDDETGGGLVTVFLARDAGSHRAVSCIYLVDVYCLGVKNSTGPQRSRIEDLPAVVQQVFGGYPDPPFDAPLELARHLVFGAVDYARGLGFEPAPDSDFEIPSRAGATPTAPHLGPWEGPSDITFGRNGKPFFIQGPYDDASRIMATLERTVGEDNYHFIMGG